MMMKIRNGISFCFRMTAPLTRDALWLRQRRVYEVMEDQKDKRTRYHHPCYIGSLGRALLDTRTSNVLLRDVHTWKNLFGFFANSVVVTLALVRTGTTLNVRSGGLLIAIQSDSF